MLLKRNYFLQILFLLSLIIFGQLSSKIVLDEGYLLRLLLITFSILLFFSFIFFKKKTFNFRLDDISTAYFLFVIYSSVSFFWAKNSVLSINDISRTVVFFLLFLLLNGLLSEFGERFLTILLKLMLIGFIISSYKVIIQIFYSFDFSYSSIIHFTGISGHKNLYSSFVFLCLVGSIFSFKYLKHYWRIVCVVAIITQISLIFLLRSRAVWIGIFVFVIVYLIKLIFSEIRFLKKRIYLSSILALFVLTVFFSLMMPVLIHILKSHEFGVSNIENISDIGTFTERLIVWDKSYELIKDNTLFGVGAGNWNVEVLKYSYPKIFKVQDLNVIFQRPHNEYIKVFSEYGIFGLVIFLSFFIFLILRLWNINIEKKKNSSKILIAGIISFLCISFFSFPLERIEHNLFLTFLLSISYYKINQNHQWDIVKDVKVSRVFLLFPLILCFLVVFISRSKYESSYYLMKMMAEKSKGNDKMVISYCDSAITNFTKFDDFSIPIYWYRGNANANLKLFDEAFDDFKKARDCHPYNSHVLNDLGSSYYMKNRIDSAVYFYKQSAILNPRFDDPKLNLTAIYINGNEFEEAKRWEQSIFHESERRDYYRLVINRELNKH